MPGSQRPAPVAGRQRGTDKAPTVAVTLLLARGRIRDIATINAELICRPGTAAGHRRRHKFPAGLESDRFALPEDDAGGTGTGCPETESSRAVQENGPKSIVHLR